MAAGGLSGERGPLGPPRHPSCRLQHRPGLRRGRAAGTRHSPRTPTSLGTRVPDPHPPSHAPAARARGTLQEGQTELEGKAASEKVKLRKTGVTNPILCEERVVDGGRGAFFPLGINL